jgi:hypothetical protein
MVSNSGVGSYVLVSFIVGFSRVGYGILLYGRLPLGNFEGKLLG